MKYGFLSSKRSVASSAVLAFFLVITVNPASAGGRENILKTKEVRALLANAKTPADHTRLAKYYTAMAAIHEAEAQEHDALAVEYARNPPLAASKHPMAPNTAEHCKFFAEHCRNLAKEMRGRAAWHEQMAAGN